MGKINSTAKNQYRAINITVTEVDTRSFGGRIVTFTICTQRKIGLSLSR